MDYLSAPGSWFYFWSGFTQPNQHKLQLSRGEKGMMTSGDQIPSSPLQTEGPPWGIGRHADRGQSMCMARHEKLVLQLPRQYL